MDEVTAFERQVARRFQHHAGPVRPVDDAAIFTAITASHSPGPRFQSMFSATSFVVAGAIVALFGGLLLAGVLMLPSDVPAPAAVSPEGTADRLTALVTEEVGPGVLRVLGDGHADHAYDGFDRVVAGPDGSVWVRHAKQAPGDRIWMVGDSASPPGDSRRDSDSHAFLMAVDTDGRLLEAHRDGLSIVGDTADPPFGLELPGFAPSALAVLPDDTIWASWVSDQNTVRLGTFDGRDWTEYATPDGIERVRDLGYAARVDDIASTPDGDVWIAIADAWGAGFGGGALVRFDGATWTEVQPFGGDPSLRISDAHHLTVAPDGSLWVLVWLLADDEADAKELPADYTGSAQALLRFDGQAWEAHLNRDVLPDVVSSEELGILKGPIVVDEAGRLWASLQRLTLDEPAQRTLGDHLIAFDGVSTVYYPDVSDVEDLAIDVDGAIWAAAGDGLYVITPEALPASG